jgi:polysaccharide export outer membrane protein
MTRRPVVTAIFLAVAALAPIFWPHGLSGQELPPDLPVTDYLLVVGDAVEIVVEGHEEYSREFVVPANGEVSFPPLGRLRLLGQSQASIEAEISKRFTEKRQIRDTVVGVYIKAYAPRQAFLIGATAARIELPVHVRYGLIEVLAMAGVTPAAADFRAITITRRREDGEPFQFTVNVEDVLLKGDYRKNVIVMSNDVIHIPALKDLSQMAYVYVLGRFNNQGRYPFRPGREQMTLTKVIALAGGFHQFARRGAVKVLRKEGNRTRAIEVDFDEIISLDIQDVILQPDDLVFVPESPI